MWSAFVTCLRPPPPPCGGDRPDIKRGDYKPGGGGGGGTVQSVMGNSSALGCLRWKDQAPYHDPVDRFVEPCQTCH